MRPICVCADDYGLSPAVSAGIREALAAGGINATSAMTNRPDWPAAAAALSTLDGEPAIGLHLNLTCGAPLTHAPRLAPSGTLPPIGRLLRARDLPVEDIAEEVGAQIASFVDRLGRAPAFVDGHQHVHCLPAVRSILFDALEGHALRDLWIRDSGDRTDRILRRGRTMPKALGMAWIARGLRAEAAERGFRTNDGFSGFSRFRADDSCEVQFAGYLRAVGTRHLVMCHPGYVDDALRAVDPVTTTRVQELAFLVSPEWPARLAAAGLTLGAWIL